MRLGMGMERYRYRTNVLVGPWRDTLEGAAADAVRSRQARFEEGCAELLWIVPGRIESTDEEQEPGPRR